MYLPMILERCSTVPELSVEAMRQAAHRLDNLTKPLGSLGVLEDLIVRLSGMTGHSIPTFHHPLAVLFAADHGVSDTGVSAYGSHVTEEMVVNICMGTAVSSVLARAQQVPLKVIDVGIRTRVRHPNVIVAKVGLGTNNLSYQPAMTRDQAYRAVATGIEVAEAFIREGHDLFVLGEMGIGNTTASTAMVACLLGLPVDELVGLGSGISEEQKWLKREVITRAVDAHEPDTADPWDVLTKLGGFEIGAMAGAMIACASQRIPVVLDGLIASTSALFASRLAPIQDYLIASHGSLEPAHRHVLAALRLNPLVAWGMHMGEGSGALFLLPILQNACKVFAQTATFEDARVSTPHTTDTDLALTVQSEPDPQRRPVTRSDFDESERKAVYKAILARRDIRSFLPDPIPDDVLERILLAAHHGPSVGYMQPWNFILIRDKTHLSRIQRVVEVERVKASENYDDLKRDYYLRLKVEGLVQAPLTICVTNDPTRGGSHVLGRNTIPETDLMSTSCAIENMWLAARVEGIGMGWVSIYQKRDIREILQIPDPIDPVAILSLGYTAHFPEIPLLERVGWAKRLNLNGLIFEERWSNQ